MASNKSAVLGIGVLGSMMLGSSGDGLFLITDRTAEDVRIGNAKGKYGAEDLNRVGNAINYVSARLRSCGNLVQAFPKTDWERKDIPTEEQMEWYLDQVRSIRNALALYQTTPLVPADMVDLTHTEANNIERILLDVDALISNMVSAYFYSGDLYGGEL